MEQISEILTGNVNEKKRNNILPSDRMSTLLPPWLFQLFSDIITIFLAYAIHNLIRYKTGFFQTHYQPEFEEVLIPGAVLTIYWLLTYWFFGLYKNWYVRSPFDEFFLVVRASFIGSFIVFFFAFLDSTETPRMLFLFYFAVLSFMVGTGRMIVKRIQVYLRIKKVITTPAIVVGNYEKAKELYDNIESCPSWGYRAIGTILIENAEISKRSDELNVIKVLGYKNSLAETIDKNSPREVLIAFNKPKHSQLMEILSICSEKKVIVKIVPDLYDIFTGLVRTLPVYGIPLIEVNKQLLKPWEEILKRFIDIAFSLCVIVIGLPVWAAIAIIVKIGSPRTVFYKQERVGKDERKFMMYKFRSMVQDAEKHGPRWAAVNDTRVTPFGKFLRKSHLDEVPQFWNVLKGEMSLVGPRPERPFFVEKYSGVVSYYKRRLIVRPGITGWWQVNYTTYEESTEEIERRLKDDFFYIENMSLKLDIEIIIRTVVCVIKGHGQA